ncbi:glycosyltransferase family 15 protein [Myriangium duriaei CBS 260.36]|uniref:Glycosyltransferase family 15 protein n=1 Tax=Myriangium duriaei CBS 260.36 TaxID=1168546 RepID=A0A9P4MQE9_9PEZI|nr:glycosyltransferase family 15 protein [Myriangium duriaei CBS 260.36]
MAVLLGSQLGLLRRYRRRAFLVVLLAFLVIVVEPYHHVQTAFDYPRPSENTDPPFFDQCITPKDAADSTPRQSGVLFMMARNNEADAAAKTVRNLENYFNQWYHYPWVFLNDQPFEKRFIERVTKQVTNGTRLVFDTIGSPMWGWPEQFGEKQQVKAMKSWDRMVEGQGNEFRVGSHAQKASYHHMCRFNSGFFFDHPAMREFKWYWRVEPGVSFTCDVPYDPFYHMAKRNKTYGYTIALWELGRTAPSLFRATSDFADKLPGPRPALWQALHEASWAPWPIRKYLVPLFPSKNARGDGWNMCHFWSNFEIADLDFFRSERYRDYFAHLDKLGGFHFERWGDAPVHSLAAAMFLQPEQIHYFEDIGYKHSPFQHCPENGCHCSCNTVGTVGQYCLDRIRTTVQPAVRDSGKSGGPWKLGAWGRGGLR